MTPTDGDASRTRTTVRVLAAVLAGAILLLPGVPGAAQEPRIEFTIRPAHTHGDDPRTNAWLIHRARPGQVIREHVVVANLGTIPLDLLLYPADALSTEQGEFSLEPIEAADDGVAGWTSVRRSEVSLQPDEVVEVPVVVRVPENAAPGDHPGAIVARTAEPIRQGGVPTLLAVGARLYLRVPGEVEPGLTLHGIRAEIVDGRPRFTLDLENTGNTLIEARGSYEIAGLFGLERRDGTIDRPLTLVPGARVRPQISHPDALLGGNYDATFTLRYAGGRRLTGDVSFSAGVPWPLIALALILLAVAAALTARIVRRRRKPSPTLDGHGAFDAGLRRRRTGARR